MFRDTSYNLESSRNRQDRAQPLICTDRTYDCTYVSLAKSALQGWQKVHGNPAAEF